MKKVFFTFTLVAFFFGSILLSSCGGDDENTNGDGDSTEVVEDGHAVGTIPLDFPVVGTDAENGEYVLTPSLAFIDDAWEDPESISALLIKYR